MIDHEKKRNTRSTAEENLIDRAAGARLRRTRIAQGLSQDVAAERIGVTFQQIQKYERGMNRISISRLFTICRGIGCRPADILPDFDIEIPNEPPHMSARALKLAVAFDALPNGPLKDTIQTLIRHAGEPA